MVRWWEVKCKYVLYSRSIYIYIRILSMIKQIPIASAHADTRPRGERGPHPAHMHTSLAHSQYWPCFTFCCQLLRCLCCDISSCSCVWNCSPVIRASKHSTRKHASTRTLGHAAVRTLPNVYICEFARHIYSVTPSPSRHTPQDGKE